MSNITLRSFVITDAEALCRIHWEAVHETAAKDYPLEILDDWSPEVSPERIQKFIEQRIPDEIIRVAEIDGKIVGFGIVWPAQNQLGAVYVSPRVNGKGVGTKLVKELEKIARSMGAKELSMDSSITAEPFYRSHGYQRESLGEHLLNSGRKMACVKMRHVL